MQRLFSKGDFNDRNTFGKFLNKRGLVGDAYEIGTHRGEFADKLLKLWRGNCLYCVDSWESMYDEGDPAALGDREQDRCLTSIVADNYPGRICILHMSSLVASGVTNNGSLDFVYVDANHRETARDLRLWWPKLKDGGIMAGHDIICPGEVDGGWEQTVQPDVIEFAMEVGRIIYLVVETLSLPWSYYMEK